MSVRRGYESVESKSQSSLFSTYIFLEVGWNLSHGDPAGPTQSAAQREEQGAKLPLLAKLDDGSRQGAPGGAARRRRPARRRQATSEGRSAKQIGEPGASRDENEYPFFTRGPTQNQKDRTARHTHTHTRHTHTQTIEQKEDTHEQYCGSQARGQHLKLTGPDLRKKKKKRKRKKKKKKEKNKIEEKKREMKS